jgi:hypothetical protein
MPRLFTRQEAESMLPEVAPLLWQARDLKKQHDESASAIKALQSEARGNGHAVDADMIKARQKQQEAALAINGIIERVKTLGAEVKDLDMGLVDFRTEMHGREVYLCWKLGEEHISWWHELDTGYATRQPLD